MFELNTDEKKKYIRNAINYVHERSEMGAADLSAIKRLCVRVGIKEDEVQQYIATLTSSGQASAQIVGRSYYIVLTDKFFD